MKIFKRIKNLWELSRFQITEFDNKLVITKKEDGKLVVAFPEKTRQARIIKRSDPIASALKEEI